MKIVIAPDSFKGSLTASHVCASIAAGVWRASPDVEIVPVPMADGGEGTMQSLIDGLGGEIVTCEVDDPLGRTVTASYGITLSGTAIIEMAQASGLTLLAENERNPLHTSTYGTGQMIKDALDKDVRNFIIGIGGSATNDGGAGMAQALGYRFISDDGGELPRGGGALSRLSRIEWVDSDVRITYSDFTIACDVDNPMLGERGASAVFSPQKGATPTKAALLDKSLTKLASRMKEDLGKDVADIPGAGAAGGLGAGCMAFLNAKLKRGVDIVIDATELAKKMAGAALVITGEGRTDSQTLGGKTVYGVTMLAKSLGIPAIVISGSLAGGAEGLQRLGAVRIYELMEKGVDMETAIKDGADLLQARAERAMREYLGSVKK